METGRKGERGRTEMGRGDLGQAFQEAQSFCSIQRVSVVSAGGQEYKGWTRWDEVEMGKVDGRQAGQDRRCT